ncbi:MAG: SH3 domain-containing protein [Chloroflexi bacterium]|nr:SH3 domain-containing protein [Chloroflexota bacterium]
MFRRCVLFSLLLLLTIVSVARGQEDGFPNCSEEEVLVVLNTLLDYFVMPTGPLTTLDDVVQHASDVLATQENSISLLPLCAEAIEMQREDFSLLTDTLGQIALQRADVPDSANPYTLRLPSPDDTRRAGVDRVRDLPSRDEMTEDDRSIRACAASEINALEGLVQRFGLTHTRAYGLIGEDRWLVAVDRVLEWREENLPKIPECLEAIELGFHLTKAASDTAAEFALNHAGITGEDNPYNEAADKAREVLKTWRADLKLTRPEYAGATVLALGTPSELPPCNSVEITVAYKISIYEVLDVLDKTQPGESGIDLADYAEAHIELRDDLLSRIPFCAELFKIGWVAREHLGANAAYAAYFTLGRQGQRNPFAEDLLSASDALVAWVEKTADYLAEVEGIVGPSPDEREVSACRAGEIAFMLGYVLPDFRAFVDAAFAIETFADLLAHYDQSLAFRARLWEQLPRCQEALELGLIMRQIASDWAVMLAMDTAGVDLDDNLYIANVRNDLTAFDHMRKALTDTTVAGQAQASAAKTYYVTANPYANIRSCASTDCNIVATARPGDALTVVDDSGDWYELRLEGGATGYIAGFLVSKTRPG